MYDHSLLFLTGLTLINAYDDLSKDKNAIQSTTYSASISYANGYVAGNAVDRNTTTCTRMEIIGENSPEISVWWKVDLDGVYNIYSVNILFKNYNGYGCRASGVYGKSCKERCPTNCIYNVCHIEKGTCFGCKPGWVDSTCNTKCFGGRYGQNCKQQCSGHCRNNAVCNHVTGQCDGGCAAGWRGVLCDTVCQDGNYGYNCVHNCSNHCLNGYHCNKQTGHCDTGCKPGYTNGLCNERCLYGYYGYRCAKSCSGNCLHNTYCDHIDGRCSNGCEAGYIGKLCNASCNEGYFCENCTQLCSSNCKTCKPTDGACSCQAGWMGPNCSIGCMKSYGEDCRYPCNEHCVNQTCNRFHGICQFGCESGYHGQKCEQEFPPTSSLSTVAVGFIGASVSACVFIATAIVIVVIRKKGSFIVGSNSSSSKDSTYAEIENQRSEDTTYQELSVTVDHELNVSESDKTYQNLALQ